MKLRIVADDSAQARLSELAARLSSMFLGRVEDTEGLLVSGVDSYQEIADEVARGMTVYVVPEAWAGSDRIYSLIPLDEEFPRKLRVVWPQRMSVAVQELRSRMTNGEYGELLHLQMERIVPAGGGLTTDQIEECWLPDADLLRFLCGGEYRRVTAIHSGYTEHGISTASVSLSGEGVPDAMWALRSGQTARCELTMTTSHGAAVLSWEGDSEPTLTVNCKVVSGRESSDIKTSQESLAGNELSNGITNWSELVRAFDLLDAARRSLKRRRTVELQFESTSERSQFKTHMTTVGCGLMLMTMFGMIGLLFAGRMLDPRDAQQRQSEVAGFVLWEGDFNKGLINDQGQQKLQEIIEHYHRRSATVLIESSADGAFDAKERRAQVVQALSKEGLSDVEVRTLARPLAGAWFKRLLIVCWVLLFLPLGIFLVMQLLLGVTPKDQNSRESQG